MTEFGKEYGTALYSLCAEEGCTEEARQDLRALSAAFREHPDYLKLLSNLSLEKRERVGIVDETLQGRVHPYVLNFLRILTERGGMLSFRECQEAFEDCYQRDHQAVEAQVTTAHALSEEQKKKLKDKIRAMTGRSPVLREKVDPALLGGVLLEMEGKRYDNTVKSRLESIRQAMKEE